MRIPGSIFVVCATAWTAACGAATTSAATLKQHLAERYADAPILFEENRGQAPKGVAFVARGLGRRILVRPAGAEVWMPIRDGRATLGISIGYEHANKAARGEALDAIAARSG